MKQHITKKQWDTLSRISKIKFVNSINAQAPKGKKLGVTWTFKADFRPSIGQMLEFLDDNNERFNFHLDFHHREKNMASGGFWKIMINEKEFYKAEKELCDTLWEAVREILGK